MLKYWSYFHSLSPNNTGFTELIAGICICSDVAQKKPHKEQTGLKQVNHFINHNLYLEVKQKVSAWKMKVTMPHWSLTDLTVKLTSILVLVDFLQYLFVLSSFTMYLENCTRHPFLTIPNYTEPTFCNKAELL